MKLITLSFFFISICLYGQEKKNRIVDDQFVHGLFVELSPKNIRDYVNGKIILEKNATRNKLTSDIDTLLIFKTESCEFTFLKTAYKTIFSHAIIRNNCIKLSNRIEIGFLKSDFLKIFPKAGKINSFNQIIVTDTAEFWNDSFYFKDGKLVKIILYFSID